MFLLDITWLDVIKNKIVFICILTFITFTVNSEADPKDKLKNFGRYDLEIESFRQCKGSKKYNVSESVYVQVKRGHSIILYGNKTNKETVGPAKFIFRLFKWSGQRFEAMVTYRSDNVCEYKAFTELIWNKFNKFDDHCNIVKGLIEIKGIDLQAMMRRMLGDRYFYGKFKYIAHFYYKTYNIECIELVVVFTQKS